MTGADGQRAAARQPGALVERAFESTGSASPRPAPQSASDQIMKPTLAEGSSASPTSPTASSAAPPRTAVSGRQPEPPHGQGRQRQRADDPRAGDRRVVPDADHEQHGQEERPDERAEEQPEAGVRGHVR